MLSNSGFAYWVLKTFENPTNIGDSYGNTSGITPQVLQVNHAYDFPLGTGKLLFRHAGSITNAIVGGWQLAGFTTFQTGQPFSVSYTAPGSQVYGASGRANVLPGVPLYPAHKTRTEWFNTAEFTAPPAHAFGTSGYDMLWGHHYQNWDMDLEKSFHFAGHYRVQVRVDVFNIANHPNFGVPSSSISNTASDGVISSVVNENRTVEVGAKFNF